MKIVNTSLNEFERNKNSKGALKIGGLDIEAYYKKRKEDYNQNVDEASQEYQMAIQSLNMYHVDEVKEYLEKNLIGKTITAKVRELKNL
jgi:hypothetical protein